MEKRLHVTLAPAQRAAVETSLRSRVAVITDGPGVGKTTLVNAGPCQWRAFGRVSSGSVKGVRKAGLEVP